MILAIHVGDSDAYVLISVSDRDSVLEARGKVAEVEHEWIIRAIEMFIREP